MMYVVGMPAWKLLARWGVPILIPIQVVHDRQAGVLLVTSPRLRGLIVEMPDTARAEELHREVDSCVAMLMEELLKGQPRSRPITAWPGNFVPA